MEYSIDHVKSVFNLIETVNPYSLLLLVSLIFPLLWMLFKKLFGFTSQPETALVVVNENESTLKKFLKGVHSFIFFKGEYVDKIVFYICITAFFAGIVVLKIGENKEEVIRQNALTLKNLCKNDNSLFYYKNALNYRHYTNEVLDNIINRYPSEFLECRQDTSKIIVCVDSLTRSKITQSCYALLESYLRQAFKTKDSIYINDLFEEDNVSKNVKNIFTEDIIYGYVANHGAKYNLAVAHGKTVILQD